MSGRHLRTVLVPLDGSGTAEWALGLAAVIAHGADARVQLIRVLSSLSRAFPDVVATGFLDEWEERQQEQEREYLETVGTRLRDAGLRVETETDSGDPVRRIVRAAGEADLVVMTAHGWSGPERAWLGHVADGVVHHVRAPVVIVRAGSADSPERLVPDASGVRRILVATDGSTAARAAEHHAAVLGRLLNAELTLFRAVQAPAGPSSPYIPHAAILDREAAAEREAEARTYLAGRAAELEAIEADIRVTATYHVAREILTAAGKAGADMVTVGTHRDSRLARIVLGSVADKVVRGVRVPVLVAHAEPD